jgi:hypothetical protein
MFPAMITSERKGKGVTRTMPRCGQKTGWHEENHTSQRSVENIQITNSRGKQAVGRGKRRKLQRAQKKELRSQVESTDTRAESRDQRTKSRKQIAESR